MYFFNDCRLVEDYVTFAELNDNKTRHIELKTRAIFYGFLYFQNNILLYKVHSLPVCTKSV